MSRVVRMNAQINRIGRFLLLNAGGPDRFARVQSIARAFRLLPGRAALVNSLWRWKEERRRYQPATRVPQIKPPSDMVPDEFA